MSKDLRSGKLGQTRDVSGPELFHRAVDRALEVARAVSANAEKRPVVQVGLARFAERFRGKGEVVNQCAIEAIAHELPERALQHLVELASEPGILGSSCRAILRGDQGIPRRVHCHNPQMREGLCRYLPSEVLAVAAGSSGSARYGRLKASTDVETATRAV